MKEVSNGWGIIKKLRPVLNVIKYIFTPLAVCFIAYLAWQSRGTLNNMLSQSSFHILLTSVLLWAALHFISPVFTRLLFRSCNQTIDYKEAFLIHAGRLPAKYLPGGIWHSVARVADYHRYGIQHRQISIYLLAENILALSLSLTLGGICVSSLNHVNPTWHAFSQLAVLGGMMIIFLLPVLINKQLLSGAQGISLHYYSLSVLSMFSFWIIAALSFVQFVSAFPLTVTDMSLIEIGGVYLFSWGVGFLAVFAPQGIGVSEMVLSQIIEGGMTSSSLLAFFALFRVVILLGDVTAWLASLSLKAISCRER
jgi:hypothetical protein